MPINRIASQWLNALLFIVVVAAGYGLTIYMDGLRPAMSPQFKAEENKPLADFSFTDLSGESHRLKDFEGKIVLVNFWASWCAPCVVEFPALLKIAEANKDKIVLIALSSDLNETDIRRFMAKQPEPSSNVYIAHDREDVTLKIFGISQLPETIIAGPDLKKRRKLIGASWDPAELQKIIDSL